MYHVMLVEPDDGLCLLLIDALVPTGFRMTIVRSVADATAVLSSPDDIDQIVTEAWLPDGSGLLLAQDSRRMGKRVFVLRKRRGRVVVYDGEGSVFVGDQAEIGAFLARALVSDGGETVSTPIATTEPDPRSGGLGRRRKK
jgi:hypothetical protein